MAKTAENFAVEPKIKSSIFPHKLTLNQLGMIVDFMTLNPKLIRGRISLKFTQAQKKEKWEELAALLNSDEQGVKRSAYQWNKSWNDLKTALKSRAEKLRWHKSVANDKRPGLQLQELNDLEIRVLKMIGYYGSSDEVPSNNSVNSDVENNSEKDSNSNNSLSHRLSPFVDEDSSDVDDPDEASNLFDNFMLHSNLSPTKKMKMTHNQNIEVKEGNHFDHIQRQNQILLRIAESVERMEKSLNRVVESFSVINKGSNLPATSLKR